MEANRQSAHGGSMELAIPVPKIAYLQKPLLDSICHPACATPDFEQAGSVLITLPRLGGALLLGAIFLRGVSMWTIWQFMRDIPNMPNWFVGLVSLASSAAIFFWILPWLEERKKARAKN